MTLLFPLFCFSIFKIQSETERGLLKFLWKGHKQEEYAPGLMEQDCEAREGRGLG